MQLRQQARDHQHRQHRVEGEREHHVGKRRADVERAVGRHRSGHRGRVDQRTQPALPVAECGDHDRQREQHRPADAQHIARVQVQGTRDVQAQPGQHQRVETDPQRAHGRVEPEPRHDQHRDHEQRLDRRLEAAAEKLPHAAPQHLTRVELGRAHGQHQQR
ncbi:MAG: hypothetical protein ABL916_19290 [Burkholderiaceae bacterium]